MRKLRTLPLLMMIIIAGATLTACAGTTGGTADLFGGKPIETNQQDIAPTGSEYELLFNKEVTNVHNALVSVLSLNRTGNINQNVDDLNENDTIVCTEALNTINRSKKVIEETIPAKNWEEKKDNFMKTVNSIIESIENSFDSKSLDTGTLSKLEVGLSALSSVDSGISTIY